MYMETSIIRNHNIIDYFEFYPNKNLSLYLRSHKRAKGGDDWFAIANLTEEEINTIKKHIQTSDEKKYFLQLQEGDTIDIMLHFGVIVLNG